MIMMGEKKNSNKEKFINSKNENSEGLFVKSKNPFAEIDENVGFELDEDD